MPILYVHGVATRQSEASYAPHLAEIEDLLERYVAPVISETCKVLPVYWGDYGAHFAWERESRPKSVLLGQGAGAMNISEVERVMAAASIDGAALPEAPPASVPSGALVPAGPSSAGVRPGASMRLKDLDPAALSDLLAVIVVASITDPSERARMLIAADEVAFDPGTPRRLAACSSAEEEAAALETLLAQKQAGALAGMGAGSVWNRITDRIGETVSRAANAPAYAVSTVIAEWREPINDLVTLFLGDVFTYIANRGTASKPGKIPCAVLSALSEARQNAPGEPVVVLTHSMGGQIVYDLVTTFLPASDTDLRIDFWCATASQVGLFEEMKLFVASSDAYSKANGNRVPFPACRYLGGWWNVWDHNDFISYTAKPIFERVDDEAYDSGVSLIQAHGEYLLRPSFYRKFADKVRAAKTANWGRP